jgi:DNA anti-recombination protein RmuC
MNRVRHPKVKKIKEFDRQTKELEAESSRAAEKLKDLESDADKLQDDLKTAICEFAEKDKKIVKEKKTSE